jgi:hypothetical protein
VKSRSLKIISVLFFSLAVLARGTTGVPNAQVEIFNSDFTQTAIPITEAKVAIQDVIVTVQASPMKTALLELPDSKSHIKAYKKCVSPDRAVNFKNSPLQLEPGTRTTSFKDIWLFTSLPFDLHANAPPMNGLTLPSIYSSHKQGASNFEGVNSNNSHRGVGLLSSRS